MKFLKELNGKKVYFSKIKEKKTNEYNKLYIIMDAVVDDIVEDILIGGRLASTIVKMENMLPYFAIVKERKSSRGYVYYEFYNDKRVE